jgi:hypothetical protein
LKFDIPNIPAAKFGSVDVVDVNGGRDLFINDERFMTWSPNSIQAYELYSHNIFAYGNVICTGLGFLIREQMLLKNNRVKSIVVLENSCDLIEWQKKYNSKIMEQLTVINCDAEEYVGKCDALLLDHFEQYNSPWYRNDFNCVQNIKHDLMWFWTAEVSDHTYEDYLNLRVKYSTLPDIDEQYYYKLQRIYFGNGRKI